MNDVNRNNEDGIDINPAALGVTLTGFGTFAAGALTTCFAPAATPEAAVWGAGVAVIGSVIAMGGLLATEMNFSAQRAEHETLKAEGNFRATMHKPMEPTDP